MRFVRLGVVGAGLTLLCSTLLWNPAEAASGVEVQRGVVAEEFEGFSADAYRDYLAWSRFDRSARRFVLVARHAGRTRRLPVPASREPFDVNIGPDRDGRVAAVYSRCTRRGPCRLYKYRFAARRERRIPSVSSRGGSEFLPSLWRGRLAFARTMRGDAAAQGPRIYIAGPGRRLKRLDGGRRGVDLATLGQLELRGRRLTFDWTADATQCAGESDESDKVGDPVEYSQILLYVGGRRSVVDAGCQVAATQFVGFPTLAATGLTYLRLSDEPDGTSAQTLVRVSHDRRRRAQRRIEGKFISLTDSGGGLYGVEQRLGPDRPPRSFVLNRLEPEFAK